MGKVSRRSRNRRGKATPRKQPIQWGFDYGESVRAAALGSLEFNNNLRLADVIGVAYGIGYSVDIGRQVPVISLIARNEEPLRLAFDEFSRWAESSDGDAIDLTFVFMKNGAYKLCVSPEPRALIDRALRYDVVMSPLSMQISWIKHIDTTSQPLKDLRKHLAHGIRPILFQGATYAGIAVPGVGPVPELIRPIQHSKELLKFEVRFLDEGSDIGEQWQRIATGPGKSARGRRRKSEPLRVPPLAVAEARQNRLTTIFPVTLWRAQRDERIVALRQVTEKLGLLPWQFDQALCNLVVSREIGEQKPHFEGIKKACWPEVLIKRLQARFETADGKCDDMPQLTVETLLRQAILDARALLAGYGHSGVGETLEATQKQLRNRGLLAPGPK